MQLSDNRQKNLNMRLVEIDTANHIEEAALLLEIEQIEQPPAVPQPVRSDTSLPKRPDVLTY